MSEPAEQLWTERVKTYFTTLGWFEGRRVDLTDLLAERVRQGWTPFQAAQDFLEQVEGLGDRANRFFSGTCGPESHREVRPIEQQLKTRLFPIGEEDGWMPFLIDEQGRFYVGEVPYSATVFDTLEDFVRGGPGRELIFQEPNPHPQATEWFEHVFKMVVYKFEGGDLQAPEYLGMIWYRQALDLSIFRWEHPFSEFKTVRVRPIFVPSRQPPVNGCNNA